MRTVVTGSTGPLGSRVIAALLRCGDDVRAVVAPGMAERVEPDYSGFKQVECRVDDCRKLLRACAGADVVYHLAEFPPGAEGNEMWRVNVLGTRALLWSCVQAGVKRVVLNSSIFVYSLDRFPASYISEETPVKNLMRNGIRDYPQSKLRAETYVRSASSATGLEYVILRSAPPYGRHVPPSDRWIRALAQTPRPTHAIRWAPMGFRHWVHATDLANGILLAGRRPEAANQTFNLASDELVTIPRLLRAVNRLPGPDGQPFHQDSAEPEGWIRFTSRKASEILGFRLKITIEQGVRDILYGTSGATGAFEWLSTPDGLNDNVGSQKQRRRAAQSRPRPYERPPESNSSRRRPRRSDEEPIGFRRSEGG
jgi:nucleoside-diphosphate-sugar epimerase